MTYDETKDMLEDIKHAKRRALNIHRDIRELELNIDALVLRPSTGRERVQCHTSETTVERVVLRLERLRERFTKAIDEIMDREDRLFAAVEELNPVEKDIIIGFYLREKTHDKLGKECGYCERQVRYIKTAAIRKISQKI